MRVYRRCLPSVAALAASLLLSACPDGGDGPDGGGDGPVAWDSDRLADAYAAYFERCLDTLYDPGFLEQMEPTYVDNIFDIARLRDGFEDALDNAYESPNAELNQEAYEACLATLEDTGTACTEEPPEACEDVFTGLLEDGDACADSVECAGDAACYGAGTNTCGVCTPRAGGGESCEDTFCTEGFDCDFSGATPVCVAEEEPFSAEVGDSCQTEDDDPCGQVTYGGLICVDDNDDGTGECVALEIVERGGACFRFGLDDPRYCVDSIFGDNYCDQDVMDLETPGNCVERPGLGESCDNLTPCKTSEAYCDPGTSVCVAVRAVGQSCDDSLSVVNNPCERGANCIDGVCEALGGNQENFPMCTESDGGS
jgi:hypothetical protein